MIIIQTQVYFPIGTVVEFKNNKALGKFTIENCYIVISPAGVPIVKYNLNSMHLFKSNSGYNVNLPIKGIFQDDLQLYQENPDETELEETNDEFELSIKDGNICLK